MRFLDRHHIRLTLWMILTWVLAANGYLILRYVGQGGFATNPLDPASPIDFAQFFIMGNIGGIVVGILFGIVELFFERRRFQRMSYFRLIITKAVIYTAIFTFCFALITARNYTALTGAFDLGGWLQKIEAAHLAIPMGYMAGVTVIISFIRTVSLKFGPGNLWKMLNGTYYHPREVERIFMFMDLKSSTPIAEKLGHVRYSQLIQDCFHDLPVVQNYKAEIYQYVGDEVILSWPVSTGVENANCLRAFFSFVDRIEAHREYYLRRHGVVPEFKAGVNMGKVIVAEIGTIKREISYHGDTMNTASRIQGMCNVLHRRLLISETLAVKLNPNALFTIEPMGEMHLKGKEGTVRLFSVEAKNSSS